MQNQLDKIIEIFSKQVELIGINAHSKMAPKLGKNLYRNMIPPPDARKSAVLIPLILESNQLKILFTERSRELKSHSGQISFPGGRVDNSETYLQTALRETNEEIGIPTNEISIIGELTELFVSPSNSLIKPFIGFMKSNAHFKLSLDEVENILKIPFNFFLDDSNIKSDYWDLFGGKVLVPYWEIGAKVPLWGATAMILMELIQTYRANNN
jgi:8-oxo-dGTP pyrophosphatase MutT (NUDIX family)